MSQESKNDDNSWVEYEMHVLHTIARLEESFSKLEDQIKEIEKNQQRDMTSFRQEVYEIRSKFEKEFFDIKMQTKIDELEKSLSKISTAKQDGARDEKMERFIGDKTKLNWILVTAIIGSSFAIVNIIMKFILSQFGIE